MSPSLYRARWASAQGRDGVFDPGGKLAGARKHGNRLWLAVPSTMK